MEKWECKICHYIYEGEIGDEENGIPPLTEFSDIPSDWNCPICFSPKINFQKI